MLRQEEYSASDIDELIARVSDINQESFWLFIVLRYIAKKPYNIRQLSKDVFRRAFMSGSFLQPAPSDAPAEWKLDLRAANEREYT